MAKDTATQAGHENDQPTGSQEYRVHTGDAEAYDLRCAIQFNLLTTLGLRDTDYLLDIGCGSLCAGRLLIPYLRPGRYFGIEPLDWLVEKGIQEELGDSAIRIKKPTFLRDENFSLSKFDRKFDFLLAQSIFSHTTQGQLRRCLSEAAKVMKPGSIFVASFFEGASNYEGDQWTFHADYTMDKMRELVEEQGLIMQPIQWDHQDLQRWILILHPETTFRMPELNAAAQVIDLTNQLSRANQQLFSIRSHPYMKLGYKIKFFVMTAQFGLRRVRRALFRLMTAHRYAGKVVIVTGASSGIGAATARAFAALGARVAMSAPASQMPALRSIAAELESSGQTCSAFPVDVTDGRQVEAMVDEVVRQWKAVDVLVNNAGVGYHGPFESMTLDDFEKVVQINLLGAARCLYAVVPVMLKQRSGQIINIASAHSRRAHPRYAAYSASKYALRGLSDALRVELAPHGVTVLTFCPPYTESKFFDNVLHTVGQIKPQRAGATPESVAAAIVDAASRGKREVIVTLRERVLDWGNRCAPALIDNLIARRYESKLRSQV